MAFLSLWITFLAATMVFVMNTVGQETTTMHRKFFHILMCLVYFPAILNDLNFIFLCGTVVMYVFIVIEVKIIILLLNLNQRKKHCVYVSLIYRHFVY